MRKDLVPHYFFVVPLGIALLFITWKWISNPLALYSVDYSDVVVLTLIGAFTWFWSDYQRKKIELQIEDLKEEIEE